MQPTEMINELTTGGYKGFSRTETSLNARLDSSVLNDVDVHIMLSGADAPGAKVTDTAVRLLGRIDEIMVKSYEWLTCFRIAKHVQGFYLRRIFIGDYYLGENTLLKNAVLMVFDAEYSESSDYEMGEHLFLVKLRSDLKMLSVEQFFGDYRRLDNVD